MPELIGASFLWFFLVLMDMGVFKVFERTVGKISGMNGKYCFFIRFGSFWALFNRGYFVRTLFIFHWT
ncbi:hypothetical protein AAV98_14115 [Bacillus sp. CHD6a]|nr:hypothetical protein AAV98_14115 [Bacillus sp. CHD6a]